MACTREQLRGMVIAAAQRYGIDPAIALAQINQESGFNPNARSGQGAMGIAQFMPGTWAQYGSGSPFDAAAALEAWGRYMSHLLARFGGDYRLALAGYHSGEGAARAALNNCKGNPRTCGYVNSIMAAAGRQGVTNPVSTGGAGGGSGLGPLPELTYTSPSFSLAGFIPPDWNWTTWALIALGAYLFLKR